jgi:hypothetical protein
MTGECGTTSREDAALTVAVESRAPMDRGDDASGDEGAGEVVSNEGRLARRGCFSTCVVVREDAWPNLCGPIRSPDGWGKEGEERGEGGEGIWKGRMCVGGRLTTALLFWGNDRGEGA